jgi:hypothetical protein
MRVIVVHSARYQTTDDRDAPARGGAYRRGAGELERWYELERAGEERAAGNCFPLGTIPNRRRPRRPGSGLREPTWRRLGWNVGTSWNEPGLWAAALRLAARSPGHASDASAAPSETASGQCPGNLVILTHGMPCPLARAWASAKHCVTGWRLNLPRFLFLAMTRVTRNHLAEQLALADALLSERATMLEPQDLPGRYGRVVAAVDRLLAVMDCSGVVAGGWAVWRHGFVGRVTQDIDLILPADYLDEFLRVATVSGFELEPYIPGRWPTLRHRETDIRVDILPEGERPGLPPDFAPTTIPSPSRLGAAGATLSYIDLPGLIELKLAAGRLKDQADVVELIRANPEHVSGIREHLVSVHARYVTEWDELVERARREDVTR